MSEHFSQRLARWVMQNMGLRPAVCEPTFCYGLEVGLRLALDHHEWAERASDFFTNDRVHEGEPEVAADLAERIASEVEQP